MVSPFSSRSVSICAVAAVISSFTSITPVACFCDPALVSKSDAAGRRTPRFGAPCWRSKVLMPASVDDGCCAQIHDVETNDAHTGVPDPITTASISSPQPSRRAWMSNVASAAAVISSVGLTSTAAPQSAHATFTTSAPEDGAVSAKDLATKLRAVPTFSLVDSEGVPYFVFGEDAKVTSYFFVSYDEAKRILDTAKESSDKAVVESYDEMKASKLNETKKTRLTKEEDAFIREEVGSNPWVNARIASVPLDTAITLATKASSSKKGGIHFQVAASSSDIEDALDLDGSDDMAEGKVPLFYFESFEKVELSALKSTTVSPDNTASAKGDLITPVYFVKSQLIDEFKSMYPDKPIPEVKTTELFATITEMVTPDMVKNGKTLNKKQLEEKAELQRLVFVPPINSSSRAVECQKSSPSYKVGQSIVVL
jgi:hypothetical protein